MCDECSGPTRGRYCSNACRERARRRNDPTYNARNRLRQREQYAARSSVYFIDCRFCGELSTVRTSRATRCRTPECKRAFNNERMREGGWATDYTDRRRKRIKDHAVVERISRRRIFDRDKWLCGICDESVDATLGAPDPLSASLDHIVPVSRGGNHTVDNVRLAHLGCNIKRGNRVA